MIANRMLEFIYFGLHNIYRYRRVIAILFAAIIFWQTAILRHWNALIIALLGPAVGLIALQFMTTVALAFGYLLTSLALRNNSLGFGVETLATALLYKISIARWPFRNGENAHRYALLWRLKPPLIHSIYYSDADCIQAISGWIKE
jgi:hypothetical protein